MLSKSAIELGVIGAVGEFLIFNHFMPPVIDVRANQPNNSEIEKSERTALMVGTGFAILLTVFSPGRYETFSIAAGALVGIDFAFKHANAVHPATGSIHRAGEEQSLYSVPDYENDPGEYEGASGY